MWLVQVPHYHFGVAFECVEQSGAVEACWAHNPEVRRSKLRSATVSVFCHGCIHGDATGGMISEVKFNGMAEPVLVGVKGDANYSVGQCQTLDTPRLLFFSHVKRENEKHMRPMRDSNPRPSD